MQVRPGCRVREVTVRADGMADGVLYYDAGGQLQEQKAELVVLACNGIGTPRLLLNSRSRQHPDGLANRSGLVGKGLMLHPYAMITGIFVFSSSSRCPYTSESLHVCVVLGTRRFFF